MLCTLFLLNETEVHVLTFRFNGMMLTSILDEKCGNCYVFGQSGIANETHVMFDFKLSSKVQPVGLGEHTL